MGPHIWIDSKFQPIRDLVVDVVIASHIWIDSKFRPIRDARHHGRRAACRRRSLWACHAENTETIYRVGWGVFSDMTMPARGCTASRASATIALALTAWLAPAPVARAAETVTIGDL